MYFGMSSKFSPLVPVLAPMIFGSDLRESELAKYPSYQRETAPARAERCLGRVSVAAVGF